MVLHPQVLVPGLYVPLLPNCDLLCHLLPVDFRSVHQLLLQHVISELELLIKVYRFEKIILISA